MCKVKIWRSWRTIIEKQTIDMKQMRKIHLDKKKMEMFCVDVSVSVLLDIDIAWEIQGPHRTNKTQPCYSFRERRSTNSPVKGKPPFTGPSMGGWGRFNTRKHSNIALW